MAEARETERNRIEKVCVASEKLGYRNLEYESKDDSLVGQREKQH